MGVLVGAAPVPLEGMDISWVPAAMGGEAVPAPLVVQVLVPAEAVTPIPERTALVLVVHVAVVAGPVLVVVVAADGTRVERVEVPAW